MTEEHSTAPEAKRSAEEKSSTTVEAATISDTASSTKESDSKSSSSAKPDSSATQGQANPKKRRKVNHACVYCRRSHMTCDSERPCSRCIKRNIGHLCHDEPRDPPRRSRNDHEEENKSKAVSRGMHQMMTVSDRGGQHLMPGSPLDLRSSTVNPSPPVSGTMSGTAAQNMERNPQQMFMNDWSLGGQNHLQDMHAFHASYMFNNSEVTNEYNLLTDFLSNSLLDDSVSFSNNDANGLYNDPLINSVNQNMAANTSALPRQQQQQLPQLTNSQDQENADHRSGYNSSNDKAKEDYYMTAADPQGMDPPEERMNKLLKAKYEAGLLKPFNYVKGYARLNQYMEKHMQPALRQKILRQLDKFRPKFRERMQSLTDIELIFVEMWFERSLMEYDRVFASMAIPACLWRRTGEIFRGNKEMAELIDVPIERLRDGKLALHEIITEDQLVSYWEKFGAIAFDGTQKAMLTSCTLKNPDTDDPSKRIPCCFSFTIRRDPNHIPSLIVGNFLPSQRRK
ncbi:hypothetical protein VTN31DRAFT_7056 [Thermomyces dupontii]|uniref:uncharacterized protein n=1 Tax=Talaromyces thermophilus TaxID=28565 RepID=UPI0037433697